jgi:hypothetical protein
MLKMLFVSLFLFSCSAFASDCYEAVAKDAITRSMAGDGLFSLTLLDSISGRIGFEVNQSNHDEREFAVSISYYKGESSDPIATSEVRSRVLDFKTCTIQALK